ncbi:pyridoxal phosphate-dependent transferase [Mycotypha africana]|uniref:pyridoxal phosphate-dependent transferase n=1 Tax=Mycotypha africana TaxID=64632 RepID=UPI002300F4FB|nr:pyridoxal phosphate-dependent transferase [Mycotypha africana]KAI8984439.1 pyridoxal phosphate-dependent transferase [Mycotypha africana]
MVQDLSSYHSGTRKVDYSKHISKAGKARKEPDLDSLVPYLVRKDYISLGAGQPSSVICPVESMSVKLKSGKTIDLDGELLSECLSYGSSAGLPCLRNWVHELQVREHKPPVDFDVIIGSGSQDLLTKAIDALVDNGDAVLVDNPTFPGMLGFLDSLNCDVVGVKTDEFGIVPEYLEQLLDQWPETNPQKRRPHCLYTVPTGGNPTGATTSLSRKKEIYQICSKYDIIIIEDDAYYYIQYLDQNRVPSFFSMDVDGRVLRTDTISKIMAPGFRIGWLSGPKELLRCISVHTVLTLVQPSGIGQGVVYSILAKWGYEGFFQHVQYVSRIFRQRRDDFIDCLERHMKGKAEWFVPTSGMFVWLKLLGGVKDSNDLIMTKLLKEKVVAVPGMGFMPHKDKTEYVRVSYSNATKEDMDEALRRFALVINEEIRCSS